MNPVESLQNELAKATIKVVGVLGFTNLINKYFPLFNHDNIFKSNNNINLPNWSIRLTRNIASISSVFLYVLIYFSIASFLTDAIDTAQHYEDRLSSFHARAKRYAERTVQAQRFAVFFNEKQMALKELLQKSLDRLSRERLRLANQRSSIYPILTRRQQDMEERKRDWDWYQICQEQFNAENERFEAEALASKNDSASCERLITDCIKALDHANKVQSSHHTWLFDALSVLKLGKSLPVIIPAITVFLLFAYQHFLTIMLFAYVFTHGLMHFFPCRI
jgi:hypothetical protein